MNLPPWNCGSGALCGWKISPRQGGRLTKYGRILGRSLGIKKCSAQITARYSKESLHGKLIIGVVNFPPKQIADFMSEFLLTGFYDAHGDIVLAVPEQEVPLGEKLS